MCCICNMKLSEQFRESFDDFKIAHPGHEPQHWSADLPIGPAWFDARSRPIRRSALRFMESFHGFKIAHWDHEPTPNPSQEWNCGGMHVFNLPLPPSPFYRPMKLLTRQANAPTSLASP